MFKIQKRDTKTALKIKNQKNRSKSKYEQNKTEKTRKKNNQVVFYDKYDRN